MTDAEVRQRLRAVHLKHRELEELTRRHYELQEQASGIGGRRYTIALRQRPNYGPDTPQLRAMFRADELEPKVTRAMDELAALRRACAESIDKIPNERHRKVLACRYLDFMSVPQIAELMHISSNAAECLLRRAIRSFKQKLDNDGTF